jgi:hypothetical protein
VNPASSGRSAPCQDNRCRQGVLKPANRNLIPGLIPTANNALYVAWTTGVTTVRANETDRARSTFKLTSFFDNLRRRLDCDLDLSTGFQLYLLAGAILQGVLDANLSDQRSKRVTAFHEKAGRSQGNSGFIVSFVVCRREKFSPAE